MHETGIRGDKGGETEEPLIEGSRGHVRSAKDASSRTWRDRRTVD